MTAANRKSWIVYGAYGFTGELVVKEAIRQGRNPILAGRNKDSLKLLSARYDLPIRAFSVDASADHLDGVGTLINCAGPFEITAEPVMDACLKHGVHYFDVTGEIPVFQAAHERHDAAIKANTVLCPGVGFDIVPTDCLAALLKRELPDASQLELAFDFGTLPSMGTTRTAIQNIGEGCFIREMGEVKRVRLGYRIRKVPFPGSNRWTVSLPWGDVFTSQISTGIPNAIVYGALPRIVCWLFRGSNSLRGLLSRPGPQQSMISLASKFLNDGPDEKTRVNTHTEFWGRVSSEDGRECSGTISGPSVYDLTADTAVAIALKAEDHTKGGGYYTASMLVGADFLSNRDGYQVEVHPWLAVLPLLFSIG